MEFFFRAIQAVSSFVLGVFGVDRPVEEPVLVVDSSYEVMATTTDMVSEEVATTSTASITATPSHETPVPTTIKVSEPVVPKPEVPVPTPPSVPIDIVTSSRSSATIPKATGLSLQNSSLEGVSERDTISFVAVLTMSDGSTKDVTQDAVWEVVGPIGSIQKGVFTAALDPSIAEFGRGPGAVTATYTDSASGKKFEATTEIFEVAAYIPSSVDTSGQ